MQITEFRVAHVKSRIDNRYRVVVKFGVNYKYFAYIFCYDEKPGSWYAEVYGDWLNVSCDSLENVEACYDWIEFQIRGVSL